MWSNDHNYNTWWFQIELFRIAVSESQKMCVYICASNINIKNRTYSRSRSPQSTWTDEKSQAAMKRWFSSSRCEVAHALEETEDEKKSIHNTTLRIQHKHLNLRPSPQVCCDPEMTIFWYCSLISIERIRPTQNWLCVHKLEITIDFFFSSSFQKTGTLWHWQICLPCLLRWGYPEAFCEVRNVVICLIAHLMLEQELKKRHECQRVDQARSRPCNIQRPASLRRAILLPRVLMLISDNSWWGSTVSWLLLSLERGASSRAARKKSWSQVLRYYLGSDVKNQRFSLLPLVSPSSILTCPLVGPGRFAADQWLANSFIDMTNETSALTRTSGQLVGMAMWPSPCRGVETHTAVTNLGLEITLSHEIMYLSCCRWFKKNLYLQIQFFFHFLFFSDRATLCDGNSSCFG